MFTRRHATIAAIAALLLPLPTAALAQETGIGEATSIECRGTVTASVVDLDGSPVDGALLSVAGQQFSGSGSVDAPCGEVGASLLAAPEGFAAAGPTTLTVAVSRDVVSTVTFTVDPVEVLGVQLERESADAAPEPPAAPDDDPAPDPAPAAELPATGPADASTLLLIALLCALLGTVLVAAAPAAATRNRQGESA